MPSWRRRPHDRALVAALVALAIGTNAAPAFGQDVPSDAATIGPRARPAEQRRARIERIERLRSERQRVLERAPHGFDRWVRDLPFAQRRVVDRRLRRMSDGQRERFYRDWDRMTHRERRDLADQITERPAARRARELPPRLRTPEMRDRIERMSPEQRRAFFARVREWREMPVDERRRMRSRLDRFGALSEDEQRALVDLQFRRKTKAQRDQILAELRDASRRQRELQRRTGEPARSGSDEAAQPAPERLLRD